MNLQGTFGDHLAATQAERLFMPFIGGEAERIERCALAAKRCLGVDASVALNPWEAAEKAGINVLGEEFFAALPDEERHQVLEVGRKEWSAGTVMDGERAIVFLNPTHDPHAGQVLSREQLLSWVWGYEYDPGSNVVDVYVGYVRKKLGEDRVATVRGMGYRFESG